ncbi:tail fiber assembly protein [Caballeronia cordobensis]|nr:tail fiber assembly protein [Caballeronia cordobensis]
MDENGEVIHRAGDYIPIENRYTPEFVAVLVDITGRDPMPTVGMVYDGTNFSEYVPPSPSPADILAANTATRDALLQQATQAINPLQDAVDLDEATPAETALLKLWKQYRVAVNRVDLTQASPAWPIAPSA